MRRVESDSIRGGDIAYFRDAPGFDCIFGICISPNAERHGYKLYLVSFKTYNEYNTPRVMSAITPKNRAYEYNAQS